MTGRKLLLIAAAAAVMAAAYAGSAFHKAARALHTPEPANFSVRTVDRSLAAVEQLPITAQFTDAVLFGDRVFISTPSVLLAYDSAGEIRERYRSGLELPSTRLGALAVATTGGNPELWLATDGAGLLAFDGRAFRQILPDDPAARQITALLPLTTGRILFATANRGVLSFDGRHLEPFQPSLSRLHVTAVAGSSVDLWVGTADQGLYHWRAGALQHFVESDGLPDLRVNAIAVAGTRAFAGTPMGIAEFEDGRFHRNLAVGLFTTALLLQPDRLLAGSLEQGVSSIPLEPHVRRLQRAPGTLSTGAIARIFSTAGATLALAPDGLYTADSAAHSWKRVIGPDPGKLTDRNISAIATDPAGRLWVGYFDHGLDIVDGSSVTHFETDAVFCVNRIAPGPQSTAVATANGLVIFDTRPAIRQVLRKAQGLLADHVTDIALRPDGMTLATPAGITFLDAAGTHSVSDFHGLVNQHVYTLAAAGDQLLAGTLGGLSVLRAGVVKASYTTFNSRLKHNWITAIQRVGDEWFVATYGAGVMRLSENGAWDAFADLRGEIVINPNAMLVTPSRVYAGTLDRGLLIYDRAAGRWTTTAAGLPSLNVTAVSASGGKIYVGTDNGLVLAAEQNLR
jgi:ligand-binding sensor domain-containing protein